MKRFTLTLFLSLLLACSSGVAFADRHNGHDTYHDRVEQKDRHNKHFNDNGHRGKGSKEHRKHAYSHPKPSYSLNKKSHKAEERYWKQRQKAERRHAIEQERRFHAMIANAARGGSDVKVWRINPETYIIKYRKGHRWYTRKFYPYSGIYDAPGLININWNPMSGWTLLPSININIPLQ